MASSNLVRDLFDLPDRVHKGEFVLKLAQGLEKPEETARKYVVTPKLVNQFDQTLGLIGSALAEKQSKAAYVHGSFGSGKSHFMALVSLLLSGSEPAWRIGELHPLREKHKFFEAAPKIAQLNFHMIGADSMEAEIFDTYLRYCKSHYPDAPIPSLFADEKLFEDAARLLDDLGDDKFFARMNGGGPASTGKTSSKRAGKGRLGKFSAGWDRARFETTASSTDTKVRGELFSALAKSHYTAYAEESRKFIDLDEGLAVIAAHAESLGYDAIVLYLDELILWMLGRASESAWLHKEAQKLVKLVEAQATRTIPIISLIARQRDLAEVVGDEYAGAEAYRLRESLQWSEERFTKITIPDSDLVAIAGKRVLTEKDDDATASLDKAFESLRKKAGDATWKTMLAGLSPAEFRQIYPFSPALLDALVGLSNSLQRERTAIRLLMELLVDHIRDLELGEVVRVGDLFDVLAAGDDPADGAMRARFSVARELYNYRFLPMIREARGTGMPEKCQRMRDDHPPRIGCSNCPEKLCRSDNRLAKTLLIAALVPKALPDLTASKLVELNHGSIAIPVPGAEANIVAERLREWATHISQIHLGAPPDPTVHLELEAIDISDILSKAAAADQEGARQRVVRDLLFEEMRVGKIADWGVDQKIRWKNTSRFGHIRFGNVRKLGAEQLSCPSDNDWRLVVDYPFDEPGYGPNDDLAVVEELMEKGVAGWTLVWLPSFFSEASNKLLGELTILEAILESKESIRRYTADLSADDQVRAENNLQNLRGNKKTKLLGVLREAYGLSTVVEADLDPSRSLDQHLHVLIPGARVKAKLAGSLGDALESYVHALLAVRYPRHPNLADKLTKRRVEKLIDVFGRLIDEDEKRFDVDKDTAAEVRGTLEELGLVRTTEAAIHLREDNVLQRIDNARRAKSFDKPTVGQVREWIDENKQMGLTQEAADVVVRCYARWSARTLVQYDKPFEPVATKEIPDGVELEQPDLPSATEWATAREAAGAMFGLSPGKALHADNLKRFEAAVSEKLLASAEARRPPRPVARSGLNLRHRFVRAAHDCRISRRAGRDAPRQKRRRDRPQSRCVQTGDQRQRRRSQHRLSTGGRRRSRELVGVRRVQADR